jgi:hypothetical protein
MAATVWARVHAEPCAHDGTSLSRLKPAIAARWYAVAVDEEQGTLLARSEHLVVEDSTVACEARHSANTCRNALGRFRKAVEVIVLRAPRRSTRTANHARLLWDLGVV